jgi:hypothetical protein
MAKYAENKAKLGKMAKCDEKKVNIVKKMAKFAKK